MSDKMKRTTEDQEDEYQIINSDDDDMVQRSSIISVQDNPDNLNVTTTNFHKRDQRNLSNHLDSKDSIVQLPMKQQLKDLRAGVAELYLGIKQKTRDENETISPEEENEEREIIMSLDSYVIIEYIKSSVDIILNLKFEEIEKRLLDKTGGTGGGNANDSSGRPHHRQPNNSHHYRNKSIVNQDLKEDTMRSHQELSSQRSSMSQMEGPPQIYEEVIQNLEADIRKHIRIEQQLKLHIESIENRIEELENQTEKLEKENDSLKVSSQKSKESDQKLSKLEKLLKDKDDLLKSHESLLKSLKDSESQLRKEIDRQKIKLHEHQSKSIIDPLAFINTAIDNVQKTGEMQQLMNQTQPMILKQSGVSVQQQQEKSQINSIINNNPNLAKKFINNHRDIGSYSSNQSFVDNFNNNNAISTSSPDRRTPDLSHPYMQTQVLQRKKNSLANGGMSSKNTKLQKFQPQQTTDNFGLQASLNALASTYSTTTSGKIGSRKLSTQSRQKSLKGASKNSWIGQLQGGQAFSNIINNNIQGLSINYSNQIIQNNDSSLQQFANNFIASQNLLKNNPQNLNEDSESSNLNSHRRCKSQNVRRDHNESSDKQPQIGKKIIEKSAADQRQVVQDLSADELQVNDIIQKKHQTQMIDSKFKKINDDISFDARINKQQQYNKESNNMIYDFTDSQNKRRVVKQSQISASTGSANSYATAQPRNASNRFQTQTEEQAKIRFNQSLAQQPPGVLQSRNNNVIGQSQSVEKNQRSRNKQFNQNQTAIIASKFDSNIFDMHFKTTTSTSTQQSKGSKGGFMTSKTNNNSGSNTAQFMSQTNAALIKQQLTANKKASNMLMKGLSPLKKQQ